MNTDLFIKMYLSNNRIPLVNSTGKSIVKAISKGYREAGISAGGFSSFTKRYFPNKPHKVTILKYIAGIEDKAHCYSCDNVLDIKLFQDNSSTNNGKQRYCASCLNSYNKTRPKENNAKQAKRRAAKIERIAPWANLELIQKIYKECPDGYHVDHIYPLQGKNSCGLHVENNLQYLLVKDNLSKGNRVLNE